MLVKDLTRDEISELKMNYLIELDGEGQLEEVSGIECVSYGELANIDDIVPDSVIFNHYEGVTFGKDDFFCNCA